MTKLFFANFGEIYGTKLMQKIEKSMEDAIGKIMAQREKILVGFIAEHGYKPSECRQIITRMPDGRVMWYLEQISEIKDI